LTVIYLFKTRHRGGENESYQTYTEFTTVINTDAGKKKKIVERDSGRLMYDYLTVGDRVHYTLCSVHTRNTINPKTASFTAMSVPRRT
jgi:hypothetical protein